MVSTFYRMLFVFEIGLNGLKARLPFGSRFELDRLVGRQEIKIPSSDEVESVVKVGGVSKAGKSTS